MTVSVDALNAPQFRGALFVCPRCDAVQLDAEGHQQGVCSVHRSAIVTKRSTLRMFADGTEG